MWTPLLETLLTTIDASPTVLIPSSLRILFMSSIPDTLKEPRPILYLQIAHAIEARIAKGEWTDGRALPSEVQLAKHYQVSLGTVRRALQELITREVLVAQQGRGTFVRSFSRGPYWNRFHRFQTDDGRLVAWRSRVTTFETLPADDTVAIALSLPAGTLVIHIVRQMIALIKEECFGYDELFLLPEYFQALRREPLEAMKNESLYEVYERETGVVISQVRDFLKCVTATAHDSALGGMPEGVPCAKIFRRASTFGNRVVEYRVQCVDARSLRVIFNE